MSLFRTKTVVQCMGKFRVDGAFYRRPPLIPRDSRISLMVQFLSINHFWLDSIDLKKTNIAIRYGIAFLDIDI